MSDFSPEQVAEVLRFVASLRESEHGDEEYIVVEDEVDREELWRDADPEGWTLEHVDLLRERLRERGNDVQLAAFDLAIKQGGFVSRASVFRVGGYGSSRRLNNWIGPFNKVFGELVKDHGLDSNVLPVGAVYDPEPTGYQRVLGYRVHAGIVRLVREREESIADD
ncbi:hypothetical protein [Gordonia westfalica]|uniref:hypothetical protein n=1 Tax=Gordonia westfalica TaxID=158898 RepID=UPI00287BC7CC|nr:hypothetical protein [Gordonia westfalica]